MRRNAINGFVTGNGVNWYAGNAYLAPSDDGIKVHPTGAGVCDANFRFLHDPGLWVSTHATVSGIRDQDVSVFIRRERNWSVISSSDTVGGGRLSAVMPPSDDVQNLIARFQFDAGSLNQSSAISNFQAPSNEFLTLTPQGWVQTTPVPSPLNGRDRVFLKKAHRVPLTGQEDNWFDVVVTYDNTTSQDISGDVVLYGYTDSGAWLQTFHQAESGSQYVTYKPGNNKVVYQSLLAPAVDGQGRKVSYITPVVGVKQGLRIKSIRLFNKSRDFLLIEEPMLVISDSEEEANDASFFDANTPTKFSGDKKYQYVLSQAYGPTKKVVEEQVLPYGGWRGCGSDEVFFSVGDSGFWFPAPQEGMSATNNTVGTSGQLLNGFYYAYGSGYGGRAYELSWTNLNNHQAQLFREAFQLRSNEPVNFLDPFANSTNVLPPLVASPWLNIDANTPIAINQFGQPTMQKGGGFPYSTSFLGPTNNPLPVRVPVPHDYSLVLFAQGSGESALSIDGEEVKYGQLTVKKPKNNSSTLQLLFSNPGEGAISYVVGRVVPDHELPTTISRQHTPGGGASSLQVAPGTAILTPINAARGRWAASVTLLEVYPWISISLQYDPLLV